LQRGSRGWCINGMPTSTTPMGTIFNGLYSFIQKNPQMGFIWTSIIYLVKEANPVLLSLCY
jgi:hypothetical protein